MKHITLLATAAVALAFAQPAAAATNLIQNGGFETPVDSTQGSVVISAGNEPTGFAWTVTEGSVDVHATNGPFGGDPDPEGAGQGALDLVGLGDKGGISQAFNSKAGGLYRLTFDFANNPFAPSAAMLFGVRGAGGADLFSQSVTHTGSVLNDMNWTRFTFEFTADSPLSTLFFTNTAGIPAGGMYLDNVSVEYVSGGVPEPATWALMISGFGLAGSALRQRRRVAA